MMQLFVAIAETGNLSAVARSWGVAPSTVTLGLSRLEERLGTQLVLRTTRRLSLTPEGEAFAQRCRAIVSDVDEAMAGFADRGPLRGAIRITATNDFGRHRIAPLLDTFMTDHPDVEVQLYLSDSIVDLVEGGFDIGIRTGPLPDSDLRARLLIRARKCICAAPGYWQRFGKPAHPKDLLRHNCLVSDSLGGVQPFWTFREDGRTFRVRISGTRRANDGEVLRDWAISGAGVILKSSFDIEADLTAGRLETVLDDFRDEATNVYAVTPARAHDTLRVRALVDHLAAALS